jgi:ribosomal protein L29
MATHDGDDGNALRTLTVEELTQEVLELRVERELARERVDQTDRGRLELRSAIRRVVSILQLALALGCLVLVTGCDGCPPAGGQVPDGGPASSADPSPGPVSAATPLPYVVAPPPDLGEPQGPGRRPPAQPCNGDVDMCPQLAPVDGGL